MIGLLRFRFAQLLPLVFLLFSCSEYQKVLKSSDLDYKLEKAIEYYYEEEKFNKAYPLLEELLTQFRGSRKAETVYYYYAKTLFGMRDHILAAYHFKNFYQTFPNSPHEDECAFMSAYCHYLESPSYSLDQSYTYKAINELQLYVNTHSKSPRVPECNMIMDELRGKLERKSYERARQYYRMELYQAAVVGFNISLNKFPVRSSAKKCFSSDWRASSSWPSRASKKRMQRYRETLTAYNELMQYYPETDYKEEAEEIRARTQQKIQELKSLNS